MRQCDELVEVRREAKEALVELEPDYDPEPPPHPSPPSSQRERTDSNASSYDGQTDGRESESDANGSPKSEANSPSLSSPPPLNLSAMSLTPTSTLRGAEKAHADAQQLLTPPSSLGKRGKRRSRRRKKVPRTLTNLVAKRAEVIKRLKVAEARPPTLLL